MHACARHGLEVLLAESLSFAMITHRAVGCVLYECSMGRPPFLNSSFNQLVHEILNNEPQPIPGGALHRQCWCSPFTVTPAAACLLPMAMRLCMHAVRKRTAVCIKHAGASPEYHDLIMRLLDKNPATRMRWRVRCAALGLTELRTAPASAAQWHASF